MLRIEDLGTRILMLLIGSIAFITVLAIHVNMNRSYCLDEKGKIKKFFMVTLLVLLALGTIIGSTIQSIELPGAKYYVTVINEDAEDGKILTESEISKADYYKLKEIKDKKREEEKKNELQSIKNTFKKEGIEITGPNSED